MECQCGNELIWCGDHDYEDYGVDGDGIVSNLSCPNDECDVEVVYVYRNLNKENK
tara:strand:+ start:53 stop:217 length:165 start_codon:yes stop_codon:yes gene_type:complete